MVDDIESSRGWLSQVDNGKMEEQILERAHEPFVRSVSESRSVVPNQLCCVLMGSQSRLIRCATVIRQKGHQILYVISGDAQVQRWAEGNALRVLPLNSNFSDVLARESFDVFFSIDNFVKVPNELLTMPRRFAVNFHDGPLPKYAGVNATNWAILNREPVHGVTWHIITEQFDAGDILKQSTLMISDHETALTLNARCYEASVQCFSELLDDIASGAVTRIRQNLAERTYFGKWKRPVAACTLDFSRPAEDLYALVRALDYGPYPNPLGMPKVFLGDKVVIVRHVEVKDAQTESPAGTIVALDKESVTVSTATRDLKLFDFLAPDGQRLIPIDLLRPRGLQEGVAMPALSLGCQESVSECHEAFSRSEDFWVTQMASVDPIDIPYAVRRQCHDTSRRHLEMYLATPGDFLRCADGESPGDVVAAAFLLYLSLLQDKDCFGVAYRDEALQKRLSGCELFFSQYVPLQVDVSRGENAWNCLASLRSQLVSACERGTFARDLRLRYPVLQRDGGVDMDFSFTLALERVDALQVTGACSALTVLVPDDGTKTFWLYDDSVFSGSTIKTMSEQFTVLLGHLASSDSEPAWSVGILSENERQSLLVDWQGPVTDYPSDTCLHALFENQVERTPERTATTLQHMSLTYSELNCRANQLAHCLISLGVGPETLVGVYMNRSFEMVLALYAILKAGGAYVPLDPEFPPDRIAFMLQDTQVPVVLTQAHLLEDITKHGCRTICVDTEWNMLSAYPSENPNSGVRPENAAYVIYTSGSTGKPKGVLNTHRGICNRLLWMQEAYELQESDRVLQKTTFSFDVSVWEFFWPLMFGARLVIAKPEGHRDPDYLVRTIMDQRITTIHFVPSMLEAFLLADGVEGCTCLRRVICSGESLPRELQDRFFSLLDTELHNLYGPTEAAVDVTHWTCRKNNPRRVVPIGKPVANTRVYILDSWLQPMPVGVPGELYIGGVQVARGYLNRPELTAERFIPDPFSDDPDARLYRTGDICRYMPDGNIEYIGRNDFQVKIRGMRVELGEIEAALREFAAIREAVVVAREVGPGDKRLVAYVVPDATVRVNTEDLRAFLRNELASYMVPAVFVQLEQFPLTASGKIDRKSLPPPPMTVQKGKTDLAPESETERRVLKIWQDVLHVDMVGVHSNFFDLGGHSLTLIKVLARLQQEFARNLSIVDLFQHPTVREQAALIVQEQTISTHTDEWRLRTARQRQALVDRSRRHLGQRPSR